MQLNKPNFASSPKRDVVKAIINAAFADDAVVGVNATAAALLHMYLLTLNCLNSAFVNDVISSTRNSIIMTFPHYFSNVPVFCKNVSAHGRVISFYMHIRISMNRNF